MLFRSRVSRKGYPPALLYFDAESGLLQKLVSQIPEVGIQKVCEILFYEHKAFDGVTLPTRMRDERDKALCMELLSVNYEFRDRIDPKLLEKPKD